MSKGNVIVIESVGSFASEIEQTLLNLGYDVTIKDDGAAGLQAVKDMVPDAVILCAEVKKMSGYAVCNKIKKNQRIAAVRVMITSEKATMETFRQHSRLKHSADAYLRKPFDMQTFSRDFNVMMGKAAEDSAKEESADLNDIVQEMESGEELALDRETSAAFDSILDDVFGDAQETDAPEGAAPPPSSPEQEAPALASEPLSEEADRAELIPPQDVEECTVLDEDQEVLQELAPTGTDGDPLPGMDEPTEEPVSASVPLKEPVVPPLVSGSPSLQEEPVLEQEGVAPHPETEVVPPKTPSEEDAISQEPQGETAPPVPQ